MTCNYPSVSSDNGQLPSQCVPPAPLRPALAARRSRGSVLSQRLRMTYIEPVLYFHRKPIHSLLVNEGGGQA